MASFIKTIDEGLRALLYAKFGTVMGLNDLFNNVILYPKDISLRKIAERRGIIGVEFINLWRESTERDVSRQRTPLARGGLNLSYTDTEVDSLESGEGEERTGIFATRSVPVVLGYNIWFWSKDRDKLNDVAEIYLFWPFSNPNLVLQYNDLYRLEFDLHFGDITDESTTSEMFDMGEYFIYCMPIEVDGWIFTSVAAKTVKKIVVTYWDKDQIEDEEEFIVNPEEDLLLFEREYDVTE